MTWEAWTTLAVVAAIAVTLLRGLAGPDTVFLAGMAVLTALHAVSEVFPSTARALAGFANPAVVAIGVLFVVAEGLARTGALNWAMRPLLGAPRGPRRAQARLLPLAAGLSSVLNNTPIVAVMIPMVQDWCRGTKVPPAKLLIPLSYATILGGSCTLIGTATNLVVAGMVDEAQRDLPLGALLSSASNSGRAPVALGLFSIAWVALPALVVGLGYLMLCSARLLPDDDKGGDATADDDAAAGRRFTSEWVVEDDAPQAGKTVAQAGLRGLPGAYLMAIERAGERRTAVGPDDRVQTGDRLIFAGRQDAVLGLRQIAGLSAASDRVYGLDDERTRRGMVEAVVGPAHPLAGHTVRAGRFRSRYDAAVVAVHRGADHLDQRIGDITLRPGDTLLLDTGPDFVARQRGAQGWLMLTALEGDAPKRVGHAAIALVLLAAMVLTAALTPVPLVVAALFAAGGMVATGCLTPEQARRAVNWRVLLALGGALGVGAALDTTGAAAAIAQWGVDASLPWGPRATLAAVFVVAMALTTAIGPIGTVAVMFPVAKAAALAGGLSFAPFAVTLMMTAAASFASPTYATNLMVYGAGGYRVSDFVKVGLPLNLIVMVVTLALAPWAFPF